MCSECGGSLPPGSQRNRVYCSRRCTNVAAYRRSDPAERSSQHREWRQRVEAERKAKRWAENAQRPCEECGDPLVGAQRSTRRYCSVKCTNAVALRDRRALRIEHIHRYRTRKRAAASPGVTDRDWSRLVARYRGCCAYCGTPDGTTVDHVVPLSRGGRHSIGNVLPACKSCNSSKGNRLLVDWRTRILPRRIAA